MTYVKKLNPDWNPQEHPGIVVGDFVDFPGNVQRLVQEGSVTLCDELGNEISAYDSLGVVTDRELEEFRTYRKAQQQQALRKSLESERETLIAEAEKIKAERAETPVATSAPVGTVEDAKAELEEKKKAFGAKMAAARAAKREAQVSA